MSKLGGGGGGIKTSVHPHTLQKHTAPEDLNHFQRRQGSSQIPDLDLVVFVFIQVKSSRAPHRL